MTLKPAVKEAVEASPTGRLVERLLRPRSDIEAAVLQFNMIESGGSGKLFREAEFAVHMTLLFDAIRESDFKMIRDALLTMPDGLQLDMEQILKLCDMGAPFRNAVYGGRLLEAVYEIAKLYEKRPEMARLFDFVKIYDNSTLGREYQAADLFLESLGYRQQVIHAVYLRRDSQQA